MNQIKPYYIHLYPGSVVNSLRPFKRRRFEALEPTLVLLPINQLQLVLIKLKRTEQGRCQERRDKLTYKSSSTASLAASVTPGPFRISFFWSSISLTSISYSKGPVHDFKHSKYSSICMPILFRRSERVIFAAENARSGSEDIAGRESISRAILESWG